MRQTTQAITLIFTSMLVSQSTFAQSKSEASWSVDRSEQWKQATDSVAGIVIRNSGLVLEGAREGSWTSQWHDWGRRIESAEVRVEATMDLFDNKTIEVLVKGSEKPFTDGDEIPHDWYGRCMIAIIDENRWIMAIRSGLDHITWGERDAIHILTSKDEGRTWGPLNRWVDGSPIVGMPYDDGYTHSEPGLYRMPNGDLILQFWRTSYSSGTKQLRSTDNGKTWTVDRDQVRVEGVTGAKDDRVLGTEDYFVDPENPSHVYMAFQYFRFESKSGTLLARSTDHGRTYSFLSWIGPLADYKDPNGGATFEPAIEYVGNRTIVAVLRDGAGDRYTWQTVSTDMGASFGPLQEISAQINGGIPNGLWQRARIYKESNPHFQYNNPLDYSKGEGRLWGFGIHSMGGGRTRKPVVYWSYDNGRSWSGPELLHGPMHPGTDTGYGDLKRRVDNTFVAATYYATRDSTTSDVEQYTFGGERVLMMVEGDTNADGTPDSSSGWHEVQGGANVLPVIPLATRLSRIRLWLSGAASGPGPTVGRIQISTGPAVTSP